MQVEISNREKSLLFWASFISLMAAAMGFTYRAMVLGEWMTEFNLTGVEGAKIFGASLWPIAITMVFFSLFVDKVGYKPSMFMAFGLQLAACIMTFLAKSPTQLYYACLCGGLGHGIIEAVINPVCASIYKEEKTKWLNILHAAWPAGFVVGGSIINFTAAWGWQMNSIWMLVPVVVYGIMFLGVRFPVDERVAAKVSYVDMLKDVGALATTFAIFLITYEVMNLIPGVEASLLIALLVGVAVGAVVGVMTKSLGKPFYFILCLLMVPLATTELGTDAWIKELMTPVMGKYAGWALVLSAGIMMVLRFQAGFLTKRFSAPTILTISSFFSMVGLMMLSKVDGIWIFVAFVLYAVGQTFYWPTVLGFVSEQYPKSGALSLNMITAVGLLSLGIIGTPVIGAFNDNHTKNNVKELSVEIYEKAKKDANVFGVSYEAIDAKVAEEVAQTLDKNEELTAATSKSGRQSLMTVALAFPLLMGVCFALIALYYKAKGGYKPAEFTV